LQLGKDDGVNVSSVAMSSSEGERKPGFWVFIRHLCSLIFGEAIIQSLKELADLVFITTSTREDYDSFTIIKG